VSICRLPRDERLRLLGHVRVNNTLCPGMLRDDGPPGSESCALTTRQSLLSLQPAMKERPALFRKCKSKVKDCSVSAARLMADEYRRCKINGCSASRTGFGSRSIDLMRCSRNAMTETIVTNLDRIQFPLSFCLTKRLARSNVLEARGIV
jgi:hypothetical protein